MPRYLVVAALLTVVSFPAAAQLPEAPAAQIEGETVLHPGDPSLAVRVPAGSTYAGGERFTLYGIADCEIHVFVEADAQRRIRRIYWIQFESYLPSRPDARYDYGESDRRMELWGATVWARAFLIDTGRPPRPGSDTERVRAIVERAGYAAPPYFTATRLVRLLDDPQGSGYGRRELMLIYADDLVASGFTRDDVITDGAPNARGRELFEATIRAAAAAFRIETK